MTDGEYDGQEEAAQIEAHPSFAAVLGRRCLVLSGDRYLCILRRSLLAAKRPMIGYAGTKCHPAGNTSRAEKFARARQLIATRRGGSASEALDAAAARRPISFRD